VVGIPKPGATGGHGWGKLLDVAIAIEGDAIPRQGVAAMGGSEVHDGGLKPDVVVALAVGADLDLGAGGLEAHRGWIRRA
jgi:hypothetical protein